MPPISFSSLVPVAHWIRDPALRSWPVLLLVILVVVPPSALVLLTGGTAADLHDAGWIFAYYFAIAWMLLLGVIVRPQHVSRVMLAVVAAAGIVTQVPIAVWLEMRLHDTSATLFSSIFTVGIPEELAKAIPILVVAAVWRSHWHTQTPRDYLFVGAVSGLVFGAAEVEHYFVVMLGNISGGGQQSGQQGGWWQQPAAQRTRAAHPPAAQPAYAAQPGQPPPQPVTASQRTTPKPWWEQ